MTCLIDGCPGSVHTRGVCMKHYHQARRHGWDATLPRTQRGGGECQTPDCARPVYSNSLCVTHYQRMRRLGTTELPTRATPEERLFGFIETTDDGCWTWQGHRAANGYGVLSIDNQLTYAHRVAYELRTGSIPAGLTIDHLCFNRMCINPAHLEAVTRSENTRRELARRHNKEASK